MIIQCSSSDNTQTNHLDIGRVPTYSVSQAFKIDDRLYGTEQSKQLTWTWKPSESHDQWERNQIRKRKTFHHGKREKEWIGLRTNDFLYPLE